MLPDGPLWIPTLEETQRHVPFSVHRPPGRLLGVAVRPPGPETWPTVRSVHVNGSEVYSVKQYAMG